MISATSIQSSPAPDQGAGGDRIGVVASVLCAIHCAVTPLLLIFAPAFGEIWSHPASHWIVALFVVPLAMIMVLRGFRIHRSRWIVTTGLLGMALVIARASIPYLSDTDDSVADEFAVTATSEVTMETVAEEDSVGVDGEKIPGEESDAATAECLDSCCPSLVTDSEGNSELNIPSASIVTTLGGVALICTHLGNLCACRKRRETDSCDSPFC